MHNRRILASWSIRKKLSLLLLVIFLPASVVIVASGLQHRRNAIVEAENNALLLARSLAAQQDQIAIGTRQTLSTLAQLPEVQRLDVEACNELFRELHNRNPLYSTISASAPDGLMFAASTPFKPDSIDLSDRKHIRDVIETLDFSAGEYQVGRVSKVRSINYAYPVLNAAKKLIAIVVIGFRLDEYARFITKLNLPEGSSLTIADHKGLRLYRFPENDALAPGMPIPGDTIERISGDLEHGIFERTGQDGIERIYGFKQLRLRENSPPYLYLIVGIAKDKILHKANLEMLSTLLILGVIASIALSLAWGFGNLALVRPINHLADATQRFGNGELDTRTHLPHTPDELGRLAKSFDDMASLLEQKNTERKKAEEALRESEEKYRNIFENASEGIYQSTPDGRYIEANPAFARILGYDSPEELKHAINDIGHQIYLDPAKRQECIRAVLEQDAAVFEIQICRKDGSIGWVSNNVRVVRDDQGRITHFEGVAEDISERKKAEEELLKIKKLEALGILAGGIAHDFNNLLGVILGNIDLALLDLGHDARLEKAMSAAFRAKDLTKEFLTFSKGGAPVKTSVSVEDLIRNAAGRVLNGSSEKCEYTLPDNLWEVEVDQYQMNQVLTNVIVNAKEAMPGGGIIEIHSENMVVDSKTDDNGLSMKEGRYVRISIRDQGTGIPEENIDRIFDPYFSTKERGTEKGMGLGLAIAHSSIKKHNGYICVESEAGIGTVFHIYIPVSD